jgi:molybdate transport system permease protein
MRRSDRIAALLAGVITALLVGFVVVPLVALFVRVPLGTLIAQLRSHVALEALGVTLKTSVLALLLILAFGTPAAYLAAGASSRLALILTTVLELPLVLPPAVAGIALLVAFGRAGLLGGALHAFGLSLPFTQVAVVLSMTFVALPLYVRQAVATFAALDPTLLGASRTLGAGPARTFVRVALPLSAGGLGAGAALAWARAVGEFGATLIFAGSLEGRTQTLPLAIYAQLQGDFHVAIAMAALLVAVSAGLLVGMKLLLRTPNRNDQPWITTRSLPSTSVTA